MTTPRRKLDQYFTPASATQKLLKHVFIGGNVLECCNGDGAISRVLRLSRNIDRVYTNDIDPALEADWHTDATDSTQWKGDADWIVSNPPFNQAAQIVPLAYDHAGFGIAMLLRLSYLEPCKNRALWLREHPPTTLIVLPRISFTGNGKTDNVTCAWMVWNKRALTQEIIIVPKDNYDHR